MGHQVDGESDADACLEGGPQTGVCSCHMCRCVCVRTCVRVRMASIRHPLERVYTIGHSAQLDSTTTARKTMHHGGDRRPNPDDVKLVKANEQMSWTTDRSRAVKGREGRKEAVHTPPPQKGPPPTTQKKYAVEIRPACPGVSKGRAAYLPLLTGAASPGPLPTPCKPPSLLP